MTAPQKIAFDARRDWINILWLGPLGILLAAAVVLISITVRNTPLEVLEARSGMRFERMEMRTDSGGAGRFRGGSGIQRDIRFVAE